MMNKLSKWLLGRSYTVLVMGEEESGKTTFIQRLKYGSDEFPPEKNAISYMGEMVEYPVNTEWWFREMRTAAREFMPLARWGLSRDTVVLWVHDCESEPALDPVTFAAFLRQIVDVGCRYFWVVLNKQDICSVEREAVDTLRQSYEAVLWKFRDEVSGRVLGRGSRVSSRTGEGVWDVLDEMHSAAGREGVKSGNPELLSKKGQDSRSKPEPNPGSTVWNGSQAIIEMAIAEDKTDPDTFWTQFLTGTIPVWNHYTYLKAGYFMILSSTETENAVSTAQSYTTHLTRLLESDPGLIHKTHHQDQAKRTVNTFWILQLQRAICEYRLTTMSQDLPSRTEFPQILRHSPHLMNKCLWDEHYSYNPVPVHAFARSQWKSPGRKTLSLARKYRSDPATMPSPARGPDRLMRYAFAVVRYIQSHGQRSDKPRGDVVSLELMALEKTTIQLRTFETSIPPYSETQAYFWIQIFHAVVRSLDGYKGVSHRHDHSNDYAFEDIRQLFKLEPTTWKEYYSEKVWESIAARSRFVVPDIKPLPNVISPASSHKISDKEGTKWDKTELPSTEELSFLAATVIHEAKEIKPSLPITSHAHLLFYLFTHLTPQDEKSPSLDNNALTLGQAARGIFSDLSSPDAGALVSAATHRNFWIQQVGVAMLHWARDSEINRDGEPNSTFAEFITSNLHLAFQELPAIYYSPAVWIGLEAREAIVQGDRRGLAKTTIDFGLAELAEIETDGWVAV